MDRQEDQVRKDYIAFHGTVAESYPGFIRVKSDTGQQAGFKIDGPVQFQPGAPISVIALRDTDKAVFVINRVTGERHRVDFFRGNFSSGPRAFSSVLSVVAFLVMLFPIVGQVMALAGGLGALIGGAASSGVMQGYPRVSFGRIVLSLCVYFLGALVWMYGVSSELSGMAWTGFLILALGAAGYAFWAKQPGFEYLRALERFIDQSVASPVTNQS